MPVEPRWRFDNRVAHAQLLLGHHQASRRYWYPAQVPAGPPPDAKGLRPRRLSSAKVELRIGWVANTIEKVVVNRSRRDTKRCARDRERHAHDSRLELRSNDTVASPSHAPISPTRRVGDQRPRPVPSGAPKPTQRTYGARSFFELVERKDKPWARSLVGPKWGARHGATRNGPSSRSPQSFRTQRRPDTGWGRQAEADVDF